MEDYSILGTIFGKIKMPHREAFAITFFRKVTEVRFDDTQLRLFEHQ